MISENEIKYMNYLVKTYDGLTKLIVATKQRLQSLPGEKRKENYDPLLKGQDRTEGFENIKNRLMKEIEKELRFWDIWERWAKKIPGIGPSITAHLIMSYYYRFISICQKCGGDLIKNEHKLKCTKCGKIAKDGSLIYRIENKDFETISKWWAYMGRHTVDGVMPKQKKGVKSNWSNKNRSLGFLIGDQFNMQEDDRPYKALLILRKEKHQRDNSEWKKGHIHNAAVNETVKIFLAHWWTVARTLDGKPVSEPYAGALMGHTNIIKPFYWEDGSEWKNETHGKGCEREKN